MNEIIYIDNDEKWCLRKWWVENFGSALVWETHFFVQQERMYLLMLLQFSDIKPKVRWTDSHKHGHRRDFHDDESICVITLCSISVYLCLLSVQEKKDSFLEATYRGSSFLAPPWKLLLEWGVKKHLDTISNINNSMNWILEVVLDFYTFILYLRMFGRLILLLDFKN